MTAYLVAPRRSPVVPRGGALAALEVDALAGPVMWACLAAGGIEGGDVGEVIAGNALYGGGNPARRAALLAGLPESVPAISIDRQCCSGLDAIAHAARLVEAGAAECVLAGGVESYSRTPIRMRRPANEGEEPATYDRPPFTPWPERDPDMAEAALALAVRLGIAEETQIAFAVASHASARRVQALKSREGEIVPLEEVVADLFTRDLSTETGRRSRVLARTGEACLRAATAAVSADAAAFALVVSANWLQANPHVAACRIVDSAAAGSDPCLPGLAPVVAGKRLLARHDLDAGSLAVAEVMEAYAVQAIACIEGLGLDPARVNRGGGALARGHPIGASGAILAVRLFHELQGEPAGSRGLAAIASAGGLGTALLLERA